MRFYKEWKENYTGKLHKITFKILLKLNIDARSLNVQLVWIKTICKHLYYSFRIQFTIMKLEYFTEYSNMLKINNTNTS